MSCIMQCVVFGAGSRWTALAQTLIQNGNPTILFSLFQEDAELINTRHENVNYLPWVQLHHELTCSTDLQNLLQGDEVLVIAVPSVAVKSCLQNLKPYYQGQTIVLASKGWNASDFSPLSSWIIQTLWKVPFVVLSGASHAEEVVRQIPTGVVLASEQEQLTHQVKKLFQNERFKCSESTDVVGVQLMWAFKNLIALACGVSDGLGYGVNTKALLLTKGIQEVWEIGTFLGADLQTFRSYAGIWDLYVTCSSALSRNRNAGRLLAQGHTKAEITGGLMNMVAEGLYMVETISAFLAQHSFNLPLLEMIIAIVEQKKTVNQAFEAFLRKC